MKKKSLILGTLATALVVSAGCNKSQSSDEYPAGGGTNSSMSDSVKQAATNAWEKTKEVTTNVMAEVKEGTTNAWADFKEYLQSATDYTYDKKDEFVAGASADADALNQKLKRRIRFHHLVVKFLHPFSMGFPISVDLFGCRPKTKSTIKRACRANISGPRQGFFGLAYQ